MFGNDNNQSQDNPAGAAVPDNTSLGNSVFPPVGTPIPAAPVEPSGPPTTLPAPNPPAVDTNHMTLDDLAESVGATGANDTTMPTPVSDDTTVAPEPVAGSPMPASTPAPTSADDLLEIKQQALQNLSPLVNKLDQTPLEKFKTTMMMIQASDDQSLIKSAYEAAEQITDEKEKAQALLDIVNEINYFTQHAEE